jgi:PAS domain S-box-containing protein
MIVANLPPQFGNIHGSSRHAAGIAADSRTSDMSDPRAVPEAASQQVSDLFESPEFSKAIETEEFRYFLDHVPIAIVVSKLVRGERRIAYANAALERLTGRASAEFRGRTWSVLDAFRREQEPNVTIGDALADGEDFLGTFRREGEPRFVVEVYAAVIENADGVEKYRIAALVDVTERDEAQRIRFAQETRDKDLLLREIQHRVKNNLQLITTLIRIEARYESSGDKASLARLARRIEALQFLYQELASAPPGASIDLGHYLGQIATAVMRAHAVEGIRLDLKVENVAVSVNVAMPLGLIVNELLTNAFKHAFAGRDTGKITLECLRNADGHCRVVVADDGAGLPEGVSWPRDGKMSALIVQTLRENAETNLNVESAPGGGTRVAISFPCDAAMSKAA